jgi:uncharacterized Zn finger protein (UPF0148 family)
MVTMACPWCDEDGIVLFASLLETEAAFSCASCGTTVVFLKEDAEDLDMAA